MPDRVNRDPFGPGSDLDAAPLARLRRLLDDTAPPPAAPVKRSPEPEGTGLDVKYLMEVASPGARPVVAVLERRTPPHQRPGAWQPARASAKNVIRFPGADDRAVISALLDAVTTTASSRVSTRDDAAPIARFALSRSAASALLPMLCRTGRFFLARAAGELRLAWRDAPWALRLVAGMAPDVPDAWDVRGVLRAGGVEVPLGEIDALLDGGIAVARGCMARVDDGGASSWLGMLLTHPRVRITPPRRAAFLEELFSLPSAPPLTLPAGVSLAEISAPAEPRLLVHPPAGGVLPASLTFVYDGVSAPARRPGKVAYDAARMAIALARLAALGAEPVARSGTESLPEGTTHALAPARLPAIAGALVAEGWRVEAGGRTLRHARAWNASIASGRDWFDLEGVVDYGGKIVPLPAVLEALRRGDDTVDLGDGTVGLLPEAWLGRHGLVLRLGAAHDGRVRFARTQLALLGELASGDDRVGVDASFARARQDLATEAAITAADPPEGFVGSLRGYQREGLGWLHALDRAGVGGLLADDMGLGKTVQVLALLAGRSTRPSLVVAPRSLVFNWKREAARFAPRLAVLDHTGGDRRPPGAHFADHHLVLTTYGTLRRDAAALAAIDFDYVVLDEAQAIKNDTSETARAARGLRGARRLALSGTPVENRLRELWSIVEFLNPGMLGRAAAWKAAAESSASPDAVALLGRALRPFLLRRTKATVAPDLPARTEETWVCELDAPDRALYDELRDRFRAELLHVVRADGMRSAGTRVLEALLRLRQAACHPALLDPTRAGSRSTKLDALIPRLVSLRESGQKALVFSQFRALLDLARPEMEAAGLGCLQLDGRTRDREGVVARFQEDPALDVLLVSLKAGGVGLNLTAAEYVFLLDPWWNPAAEAQAIDRAHRIGQTRPVFAYRMIARDTVEERIAELGQQKRALAESVIRGDGAPLRDLSAEDLERLLS